MTLQLKRESDWWLRFLDRGKCCRTKAATMCGSEGDHKIVGGGENHGVSMKIQVAADGGT